MSPIEVENIVIEHPAVLECAVIGKTDGEGLLKTAAYVVPAKGHAGSAALEEDLKNFV